MHHLYHNIMYLDMYMCVYIYVHTHTYMYVCVSVCACECACVWCLCVCECVCVCVCVGLYGPTSGDNFVFLTCIGGDVTTEWGRPQSFSPISNQRFSIQSYFHIYDTM